MLLKDVASSAFRHLFPSMDIIENLCLRAISICMALYLHVLCGPLQLLCTKRLVICYDLHAQLSRPAPTPPQGVIRSAPGGGGGGHSAGLEADWEVAPSH